MTQPPLSQSIQLLEKELGVKLFERTKRSVRLTALGKQWFIHARRVLHEASALRETARKLAFGELGLLRISFVRTADYSVLPTIISRFRASYPQVEISLREATSDLQLDALLTDQMDVGMVIVPPPASLHQMLTYRPILREPLVAAVPSRWIEEGREGYDGEYLRPADFFTGPLILFPRRSAPAFHDLVAGYFAEHGAAFSVFQEAIQMQTIIGLVASGLGVALVPRSLTQLRRDGASYLPLAGRAPEVETGLIWRSKDQTAALSNFLAVAGELVPSASE
jgi:DNA-binding transcriptional LysR family regulator